MFEVINYEVTCICLQWSVLNETSSKDDLVEEISHVIFLHNMWDLYML